MVVFRKTKTCAPRGCFSINILVVQIEVGIIS